MPAADAPEAQTEPPTPAELAGFRTIRRRRRWFWIIFLTYVPCTVGVALINQNVAFFVAICWMVAFGIVGTVFTFSRCPRCGQFCFFRPMRITNTWRSRCVECGIRLYWKEQP